MFLLCTSESKCSVFVLTLLAVFSLILMMAPRACQEKEGDTGDGDEDESGKMSEATNDIKCEATVSAVRDVTQAECLPESQTAIPLLQLIQQLLRSVQGGGVVS